MKSTFQLQILSLRKMLFNGAVESVYLYGDEGEYELLAWHFPLLGALPEGDIRIAGFGNVPIRAGVVMFNNNICIIVVEESDETGEIGESHFEAKQKQSLLKDKNK